MITNWNLAPGKSLCWLIFKHAELYYACSLEHAQGTNRNVVISVSPDLENWAVYHRFAGNEKGALRFAGAAGGKLHLTVWEENNYRYSKISPASVLVQKGLVLSPPTANLYDTATTSSAESVFGWVNQSQEVPPGSGYCGLLEYVTGSGHHGPGCVHYTRGDGGYMVVATPPVPFEVGRTYVGRLHIRGRGGKAYVKWSRNLAGVGEEARFAVQEDEWRRVVTAPYSVPSGTTDLRLRITLESTGDHVCDVYIDALQVEEIPPTPWQLGGTPRDPTKLTAGALTSGEWTNVFSFEPDVMSEDLYGAGEFRLRTYWLGPATSLELFFDGADSCFKLRPVVDGVAQTPLATSRQHFQNRAYLRIAVRAGYGRLALTLANGQPAETVQTQNYQSPGPGVVTISCGEGMLGRQVLPGAVFNDVFADQYVSDMFLPSALNDLSSGADLYGDANCDGVVDGFDIQAFVLALTATPPDYPEYYAAQPGCDVWNADCNYDGQLDGFDIQPFVDLLTGR